MSALSPNEKDLLTSLLRDVSRSFYLTLRVLPAAIRHQIGLAYLLARASDTIADTGIVSPQVRLLKLSLLRERIGGADVQVDLGTLAEQQGSASERELLKRISEALRLLDTLSAMDRVWVRTVLKTIISGQELDLERFANASPANIVALARDEELDDYTYRVAGCVGEFWTELCLFHVGAPRGIFIQPPIPSQRALDLGIDYASLTKNAARFGKGLQLVNILRDLPSDLRSGRCYLPIELLTPAGLTPHDLLTANTIGRFRPLYDQLLGRAQDHLAAGWLYTNTLPFSWMRVRLACAWPILIGLRTIAHLRRENPLDAARRVKVSRGEVKSLILLSLLNYSFPPFWKRLYNRALMPPLMEKPEPQSALP